MSEFGLIAAISLMAICRQERTFRSLSEDCKYLHLRVQPVSATPLAVYGLALRSPRFFGDVD